MIKFELTRNVEGIPPLKHSGRFTLLEKVSDTQSAILSRRTSKDGKWHIYVASSLEYDLANPIIKLVSETNPQSLEAEVFVGVSQEVSSKKKYLAAWVSAVK